MNLLLLLKAQLCEFWNVPGAVNNAKPRPNRVVATAAARIPQPIPEGHTHQEIKHDSRASCVSHAQDRYFTMNIFRCAEIESLILFPILFVIVLLLPLDYGCWQP